VDTNVKRVLSRAVNGLDSIRQPATAADRHQLDALLPLEPAKAARFSAAVMELGALVCTATNPKCGDCPIAGGCAWRAAGYPAATASRSIQAWAGSDRQVRGLVMALLRDAHQPLAPVAIDVVWPDAAQLERCVASLIVDQLAVQQADGSLALPG
jgi:A/G-specific adenine glycosylase